MPWIVAFGHRPLYCSGTSKSGNEWKNEWFMFFFLTNSNRMWWCWHTSSKKWNTKVNFFFGWLFFKIDNHSENIWNDCSAKLVEYIYIYIYTFWKVFKILINNDFYLTRCRFDSWRSRGIYLWLFYYYYYFNYNLYSTTTNE